ncbi:hypothetical protein TNCV_4785771 [Trichonephila clavipes]|nr:hypothetical protein TNCV_4785771 [Trichonephila clavipes]
MVLVETLASTSNTGNTWQNDTLEFVQSPKHIIYADSDDENEMTKAAPVPTSFEWRNAMKSMRSYSDALSNGKINNKMGNIDELC